MVALFTGRRCSYRWYVYLQVGDVVTDGMFIYRGGVVVTDGMFIYRWEM